MGRLRTLQGYLIVSPKGYYDISARYTSRPPALAKNEVAIKLGVSVPDALFNRPQLQAEVRIPEECVTAPVLNAEVLDNVREVLQQQTGMDISVRVVEPE